MRTEFSKFAFWAAVVTGTSCILVLATLTFQSLFRLVGAQPEKEKATTPAAESARSEASGRGNASERASPGEDVKSFSDAGKPPFINPAPAPVRHSAPSIMTGRADFSPDFQAIREQEKGRREMIETLRRQARENPEADNIPSEEQLKKIEESKADFL